MARLATKVILLVVAIIAFPVALLRFLCSGAINGPGEHDNRQASARGPGTKLWGFRLASLLVIAGLGGFLVVASGIVPIRASSGHWAVTAWFLNFAMRRSVVTYSLMIEPPPVLDDEGLVIKGAGHYEFGCRPCHGSPASSSQPRVAQAMTPRPPNLSREVPKWNANELFYIVKHGVKFTGMPAWPAQQRDDEVWAMVAFLLRLPDLNAEEYRDLAGGANSGAPMDDLAGAKQAPRAVTESCARCHGRDGSGRGMGVFPIIAGQRPDYLYATLLAFARGERHSGIMQPLAAGLSKGAMAELARYYADFDGDLRRKTPNPKSQIQNPKLLGAVERGRGIAMRGIPSQGLPACAACHGPGSTPRNPLYPQLSGQYFEYLLLQLSLFKADKRGGTPYAHLMRTVASRITAEQARDAARYYSSLPPTTGPSAP